MHKTKAFGLYTCTLCDHMFGGFYLVSMHLNTYFIFSTNSTKAGGCWPGGPVGYTRPSGPKKDVIPV